MLAFSQTKLFSFLLKFWSKILSGKQWGPLKEKSNIAYTHQRQAFTPSATSVAATNPQCKDNPTNQKVCIDGKLCSSIIIMGIKWVPSLDTLAAHAPPPSKWLGNVILNFFVRSFWKYFCYFRTCFDLRMFWLVWNGWSVCTFDEAQWFAHPPLNRIVESLNLVPVKGEICVKLKTK